MTSIAAVPTPDRIVGEPRWLKNSLHLTPGRDPLGFQTITIDQIMPSLLPGVLALSRRARYFSFYPFLLHEYQERRMASNNNALSEFVRSREFEYAAAVQLCPHGCGRLPTALIGKEKAGPAVRRSQDSLDRDFSVDSFLGGYGLYYRSPLSDLRLIARAGTPLGDRPTSVDVLLGDRAVKLALAFKAAISDSDYYRNHMYDPEPIPVAVLQELGERACLCRLTETYEERNLIRDALLRPADGVPPVEVNRRHQAFSLFLRLLERDPRVAINDMVFRSAIWEEFERTHQERTARASGVARWAALVAKEYLQEGFSSIWSHICRLGYQMQGPKGLDREDLARLVRSQLIQPTPLEFQGEAIHVDLRMPTSAFEAAALEAARSYSLEELRAWASQTDTALAGMTLLFVLYRRLLHMGDLPNGWGEVALQHSDHQPGLAVLGRLLRQHIDESPTLADTFSWLVHRYVLDTHETIAYSRLPNNVFRFRWEQGRLRFFDNGLERFVIPDNRRDALARISEDLGFWKRTQNGDITLTEDGARLVAEAVA
ncbi:MAG: hypothetical protein HY675_29080 [Chloroflexi bacterium]|nr:hypothetical protein [Chloroflexota bacterium]